MALFRRGNSFENIFEAIEANDSGAVKKFLREDPACIERPYAPDAPDHPLHIATWQDRKGLIELLIKSGADVNARGDMDRTPLHYAARHGCIAACDALLQAGADVNLVDDKRWTPLLEALRGREQECVDIAARLHKSGTKTELSALVALGEVEAVRQLLRNNKDAVAEAVLPLDLIYDFVIMLGGRISEEAGYEATEAQQAAVIAKYQDILTDLVAAGADINGEGVSGEPPLFAAVGLAHSELVRLLLDHGANVNIQSTRHPEMNALTVRTGSDMKGVHRVLREYGFNLYKRGHGDRK